MPKENIAKLKVSKNKKLSSTTLFLDEKQNRGIIEAEIEGDFESKTQKQLNSFFGLKETNPVYVNGYLIENKERNILTKSIKKIELIKADKLRLEKDVLNITIE
jgi:predicted nucleotidyltransferase